MRSGGYPGIPFFSGGYLWACERLWQFTRPWALGGCGCSMVEARADARVPGPDNNQRLRCVGAGVGGDRTVRG